MTRELTPPSELTTPRELTAQFEMRYRGGTVVPCDLRLPVDQFSVTVLFGPSGCGKTTILRCLAGLENPAVGSIHFANEAWFDAATGVCRSPQERDIGFLFQEYALFPHLTVAQNIGFGLRQISASQRRHKIAEILDALDLRGLDARYPHQISGGQQQRVALARVLARRPRLLLLDEPLCAIDDTLRAQLRLQLRSVLAAFAIPTVLVTHDESEANQLGHQMVRLKRL